MAAPNYITLSVPTSANGSTAAATFMFMTTDYKPPRQGRSTGQDVVHNQNGIFKYRYDNGPNVRTWDSFTIVCNDAFKSLGTATQQYSALDFLWRYVEGSLKMSTPDGVYNVDWSDAPLEPRFVGKLGSVGDKLETRIVVNFEEGG